MLDESEFLSPHGLRSVSRWHAEHPFRLDINGTSLGEVDYEPAESRSGLFGGNSNWRGPVWFPLNYLIIEALQKFDWYYGSTFTIEYPTGSGKQLTLWEVSVELSRRLIGLFVRHDGLRAVLGDNDAATARSSLAGSHSISRILQRRHRRRTRRVASDRLDRARRQTRSTERRAESYVTVAGAGATAARTAGATLVPKSSIDRMTAACGVAPTLICPKKRSLPNSSRS